MSVRQIRIFVAALLVLAIAVGISLLFFTRTGHQIMSDPRQVGPGISRWVDGHLLPAFAVFFGLYILLTLLFLPVWSLQALCGYVMCRRYGTSLGLLWGLIICQIAGTAAAIITFYFSRWLAADWFHKKVETRMQKLRSLDEKLGHNGFLLVMAVRLMHVMPFALSNYAFGLLSITAADVFVGTMLGGVPGVLLSATIGGRPHMLGDWRFSAAMVILNMLLIVPVALRYLRPQWFKKIGVE